MAPHIPGNRLPQLDASPQDLSGHPMLANANRTFSPPFLHGVQRVESHGIRLNLTAEGIASGAQALELTRAVPDPLRDAGSDEEGCLHGHFGPGLAPEGDFWSLPELSGEPDLSEEVRSLLTEVDLSDGGMDLWHGWHGSSSLYRYLLVKLRWLQWLE